MIKKIEHIGIAVKSISESLPVFEALFDKKAYKTEIVDSEFVKTAFIRVGESKIELLEATNKSSAIAKFLEKNQGGAIMANIEGEISRLGNSGFNLIHQTPKQGADNKRIAFLHPKSTKGILVELCQENS